MCVMFMLDSKFYLSMVREFFRYLKTHDLYFPRKVVVLLPLLNKKHAQSRWNIDVF